MNVIRFQVRGLAQPKGSAKIVPLRRQFPFAVGSFRDLLRSVAITSDNARVKAWQKDIARAARLSLGNLEMELTGAITLEAVFYLPRPTSRKTAADEAHVTRPDVDKLARAVADALTGIVWHDDSQVTDLIARKRYAETVAAARVDVTITPIAIGLPLFPDAERTLHADARSRRPARAARPAATGTDDGVPW
jgi:crossover junction endodeoxyribonuclease RusA